MRARGSEETHCCPYTWTTFPVLTLAIETVDSAPILVPRARTMATLLIPLKENLDEAPGPCRRRAGTRRMQDEGRDSGDRYRRCTRYGPCAGHGFGEEGHCHEDGQCDEDGHGKEGHDGQEEAVTPAAVHARRARPRGRALFTSTPFDGAVTRRPGREA